NEFAAGEKVRQEKMHEYKTVLPKLAVISPTYACNLRCVGCYAALYGHKYQLSKEEMFSVIRQFNDLGIYFFIITGGEPYFYPYIYDVFKEFNDSFFMTYTNGTLIDDEHAKLLSELGNVTLAISIEGFEEMTDWRRGKGVFNKVKEAWNNLNKYGVIFGASVTATRVNHELLMSDEFWDYLAQNGVAYAWVFQFMPVGADASMDLVPTPEQRYERFRKTDELRLSGKFAFVADFWNHGFLTHGCLAAGSKYLHINAKGYAEPCVFQQFAVDNI
ncbi:MAG TPA: radical SAM protein, partial [Petrotogaceae bacterium]|nr:radical SAM protein [Petrotogaceae bacterium]